MFHLAKIYNKQFLATFSYKKQIRKTEKDVICVTSLFNNFLVYKSGYNELPIPKK